MIKQFVTIILIIALITLSVKLYALQLRDVSFLTGWILVILGSTISLLFIGRRYHDSPGPSAQRFYHVSHLILGWVMLYAFLLHIEFKLPAGLLEWMLAFMFMIICVSGIVGLIIHFFSRRSTAVHTDSQISSDKLPSYRKELRVEAENIVISSTESNGSKQLAEFYSDNLHDYFNSIPGLLTTLFGQRRTFENLLKKIQQRSKLLPEDQHRLDELRELIHKKSAVEHQHAWHTFFSSWLAIHKYITYSLVVFIVLHIILVYVFVS